MFNKNNNTKRKQRNINHAANLGASLRAKGDEFLFAIVTDAVLVMSPDTNPANSKYIWKYKVKPAKFIWAGLGNLPQTAEKTIGGPEYDAFSISEIGNVNANTYSYGVPLTDLPAGIRPTAIPLLRPVFCWGHKRNDGTFYYLIINTQAITGQCPTNLAPEPI